MRESCIKVVQKWLYKYHFSIFFTHKRTIGGGSYYSTIVFSTLKPSFLSHLFNIFFSSITKYDETLEEDSIVEVKQDFMVSPSSHTQSALAYLLKSIANLILKPTLPPSSSSSSYFSTSCFDPKICSNGWHYPPTKWVRWVDY